MRCSWSNRKVMWWKGKNTWSAGWNRVCMVWSNLPDVGTPHWMLIWRIWDMFNPQMTLASILCHKENCLSLECMSTTLWSQEKAQEESSKWRQHWPRSSMWKTSVSCTTSLECRSFRITKGARSGLVNQPSLNLFSKSMVWMKPSRSKLQSMWTPSCWKHQKSVSLLIKACISQQSEASFIWLQEHVPTLRLLSTMLLVFAPSQPNNTGWLWNEYSDISEGRLILDCSTLKELKQMLWLVPLTQIGEVTVMTAGLPLYTYSRLEALR